MVRLGRFELPTSCFGGTRSIHLSYSRVVPLYHALGLARIPALDFRITFIFGDCRGSCVRGSLGRRYSMLSAPMERPRTPAQMGLSA
jgi:hypothetical protein